MADNILDDVVDQRRPQIYTRPYQLPLNVAFDLKNWTKVPSGYTKPGEEPKMTSRCILKCDSHTDLMTYPGGKFDGVTDEKMKLINEAIAAGKKWYLVANYWTNKDRVPIDIIPASKRELLKYPLFDSNVHVIRKVDSAGKFVDIPAPLGNDSGQSPTKRFKSE